VCWRRRRRGGGGGGGEWRLSMYVYMYVFSLVVVSSGVQVHVDKGSTNILIYIHTCIINNNRPNICIRVHIHVMYAY